MNLIGSVVSISTVCANKPRGIGDSKRRSIFCGEFPRSIQSVNKFVQCHKLYYYYERPGLLAIFVFIKYSHLLTALSVVIPLVNCRSLIAA